MTFTPLATRRNLIDVLGLEIGPRVAGSPEARRASEAVAAGMRAIGLEVSFQEFEFLGYEPGEPFLEVDGHMVAAGPILYSRGALVEGTLRHLGVIGNGASGCPVFGIVDPGGVELARLYTAPGGAGPVPLGCHLGATMAAVSATVSEAAGRELVSMVDAYVKLQTQGRLVEGMRDRNVLGYRPGASSEYVVVSSHFDSVWRGPGVVDNATGVEGMLQVAERLAHTPQQRGLMACAFGGEETGLVGSRFFVEDVKMRGTNSNIVGVVNLDSIAHGEHCIVNATPEALEDRVFALAGELGLAERYTFFVRHETLPYSDDYYFAQEGIPTVSLVHYPYPEYHSAAERLELIDFRRVEDTVELAARVLQMQCESPVPGTAEVLTRRRVPPTRRAGS